MKALGTGVVAAAAALLWGGVAEAQTSSSSPVAVVRERNERVQRMLDAAGDPISDATREELKDVINGLIDFEELSRRALHRHWDDRTPRERQEFIDVFRKLVRNSSVQKLEIYRADRITYRPAEVSGDEARVVTIAHEGGNQAEIVYLMHRTGGEWKAYDVIIDGSSTLRTYRDSFQREIRASSYTAMYNRMVERLEQTSGGAGA